MILDSAPAYYQKVEGVPSIPGASEKVFEDLPPGLTYDEKYVFFILKDETPIGVVDLVIGYPDEKTAFIGLLLLDERFHGKGLGKKSYHLVEEFIGQFNVDAIQLGVNDTNEMGMTFWPKLGFRLNGRTRPNQGLLVTSTVYVMEKKLKQDYSVSPDLLEN